MRNRSWGCSVTRTCLKNTVTDPAAVRERSPNAKSASSKRTAGQAEAMATPTIDQSVTDKEGVDALNTLILRKLAKESFMSEGGSRKVGSSGESHCNKKASTWETQIEARSATVSCKCGSHVGKELFSSFPNLHNNTMYMDTTKSNPGSFDGGKIPEGVGSLMSRIGLDNKKKPEPELPLFQNSSRFDRVLQPRTLVSTQDFLKSMPSKDAGEWQGAVTQSSTREFLSISTEQASNFKGSMHTVGHMWCIPEANSVGDVMCTEYSPSHRCSATGHEKATDSRSNPACPMTILDELAPLENDLLKPHVNSPEHDEAALEEFIKQSLLDSALTEGMQLRIDEAARDLQNPRSKQHTDSPLDGTELIRKVFRDEGVVVSSKTPWPEQRKTAAHVRWNLRELMQREEIEDDVDAKLRTGHMPKPGSEELGCLEELVRSLVGKQHDIKQEDSVGGPVTPRKLEHGIAKLKHEEVQLDGVSWEGKKTEPNATPRSLLIAESTKQGVPVQKRRIARRASLRQNHVHSSFPGDNGRSADANEEDDELFQGQASTPETRKFVMSNGSSDDSAAVPELEVDWGTDREDLEVLLQFLTMKQQLRENRQTDVEVVVETEAIVRALISRMKLDSDWSSSVDSHASGCFLPRSRAGEPVVDDGYGGGRKCREQGRTVLSTVGTRNAAERDELGRLTFKDSAHPQSRPAIRRPPFVVPSSSKSQSLQRMVGSMSTKKATSCVRNYSDQSEEYRVPTSPSRNSEEARKRSRCSSVGARQAESCQRVIENTHLPAQKHVIGVVSEKVDTAGSHSSVGKGGSSTVTGMDTVDGTSGGTQELGSTEYDGISNEICALTSLQKKVPHGSPIGNAMPLHSARNLESRSFASNAPAMIPWNYQREKQLPIDRNVQLASPNKRSTPKSPSEPEHRRQCRDSPTTRSSPNNRPSPVSSPQRQQKPRPATAISKFTATQLGSPKRPSPLSSPQRQQKSGPAMATLLSTAAQVESPKPSKTLSKEQADHMSTAVISKPSHDLDKYPAGISEAVVQESIALAKDSSDPYADFRDSMLEMMQEKNLWQRQEELQDLLQCFLHLNQPVHHQLIHQAFSDVVYVGSPVSYSKKERSNQHFSRRSSPSRQLYKVSQCKSPLRGGG